jgi:hypothetical protein
MPNAPIDSTLQQVEGIDWNRLNEQQAAGLGLSLGMFNDAAEEDGRARVAFMSRASSLIVAGIVGLTLQSWFDPRAAIGGIIAALGAGTLLAWWRTRRTARAVAKAQQELNADVAQLPREPRQE